MTIDEYLKLYPRAKRPKVSKEQYHAVRRAAVASQHVTQNKYWDEFLTHLTSALKSTTENIEHCKRELTNITQLDVDYLMHQKVALAKASGIEEALSWVMSLPKALMDNNETIRSLYEEEKE